MRVVCLPLGRSDSLNYKRNTKRYGADMHVFATVVDLIATDVALLAQSTFVTVIPNMESSLSQRSRDRL